MHLFSGGTFYFINFQPSIYTKTMEKSFILRYIYFLLFELLLIKSNCRTYAIHAQKRWWRDAYILIPMTIAINFCLQWYPSFNSSIHAIPTASTKIKRQELMKDKMQQQINPYWDNRGKNSKDPSYDAKIFVTAF